MDIKGKIIQKMEPVGGVSKAGNQWKKQEYVLETLDSYPKNRWYTDIRGFKAMKEDPNMASAAPAPYPPAAGEPAPAPVGMPAPPPADATFDQAAPADDLPF